MVTGAYVRTKFIRVSRRFEPATPVGASTYHFTTLPNVIRNHGPSHINNNPLHLLLRHLPFFNSEIYNYYMHLLYLISNSFSLEGPGTENRWRLQYLMRWSLYTVIPRCQVDCGVLNSHTLLYWKYSLLRYKFEDIGLGIEKVNASYQTNKRSNHELLCLK